MKQRLSNIELLRIISMLMILALHVNFFLLGSPSKAEINFNPLGAFSRTFLEFVCIVAVNVFVLISGWFGINVRKKGLLSFLYQILFFYLGIYLVFVLMGEKPFNLDGIEEAFFLKKTGWFIKAYLCLYFLSPVLNMFVEKATERQLKLVLLSFFLFQSVYGWLYPDATKYFAGGYSAISFLGLYLLARYVRLYGKNFRIFNLKYQQDLVIFLVICLLETIFFIIFRVNNLAFVSILWIYSSPFVIISALYLLLCFSKLNISSKSINRIAKSSFSAYLFHSSFCIMPFYKKIAFQIYYNHSSVVCLVLMFLFIVAVYLLATLIDKLRILTWNRLNKQD